MTTLTIQDITPEWVEKNRTVKRKKSHHSTRIPFKGFCLNPPVDHIPSGMDGMYYHAFFPSLEYSGYKSLPEMFQFIEESVDYSVFIWVMAYKEFEGYVEDSLDIKIGFGTNYDAYDDCSSPEIEIVIDYDLCETREQAIKRIMKSEKGKITRATNALKKEKKEREEYERLKAKFGE